MHTTELEDSGIFIRRLFWAMGLPSVIANACMFISQIAGTAISGNVLSEGALIVASISSPVYYIYGALAYCISSGCTATCSNYIGESKFKESRQALTTAYVMGILLTVILTATIWIFIDPIASMLGATAENASTVRVYCLVMATGGIGLVLNALPYNLLKIDGRNKTITISYIIYAFISLFVSSVLLIILKTGAWALAASICAGAMASGIIGSAVLLTKSSNFKLTRPKDFTKTAKRIFSMGTPGTLEFICFFVRTVVLNKFFIATFGEHMVAAFKVTESVSSFALIFIWGLTGSIISLVGIFAAEHDTKSIRDILILTLTRGFAILLPLTVGFIVFAHPIAELFGTSTAFSAVRIFAAGIPLMLINQMLINLYHGSRRIFLANTLMAFRMVVWVVALVFPLSVLGEKAVWWCFALAELLSLVIIFIITEFIRKGNKNLFPLLLIDISSEREGKYKSFSVENGRVAEASAGIVEFCEKNRLSPKLTMSISLAIEEMLIVIFEKSMPKSVSVRILIMKESGVIILRTRAGGILCNPIDYAMKANEDKAMEVMGVKLIMQLAANVDYRNTFGMNNTTVTLKGQSKNKAPTE